MRINVQFRASYGTIGAIGMKKLKADDKPTTAYLMIGHACVNDCAFCTQAVSSIAANADKISRVTWPEVETDELMLHLKESTKNGIIKRLCIQVVGGAEAIYTACEAVKKLSCITKETKVPISVSFTATSCIDDIKLLIDAGADIVSLPIDACNPNLYKKIKGGDFFKSLDLIQQASQKFPGHIGTHIIIGLGETEKDVISLMCKLKELNVGFGLFAFTPITGTRMQNYVAPEIKSYRRIQLCAHLIRENITVISDFNFSEDLKLESVSVPFNSVKDACDNGIPFQTSGCNGCNRPYFNEKPGKTMYNYPRPLSIEEAQKAFGLAVDNVTFNNNKTY